MLNNRAYIGEAVHKGTGYAGEHQRLIDQKTWDRVHGILQESPRVRPNNARTETPALLKGLLYGEDGAAFSPTHTRKGDRLYRYYVSQTVLKHGAGTCPVPRVPAAEIEAAVVDQVRPQTHFLVSPGAVRATIWASRALTCASRLVTENISRARSVSSSGPVTPRTVIAANSAGAHDISLSQMDVTVGADAPFAQWTTVTGQ